MATTKAGQKAVNKYIANSYDRINLIMPKGKKEQIKAATERELISVNAFINQAIDEFMKENTV